MLRFFMLRFFMARFFRTRVLVAMVLFFVGVILSGCVESPVAMDRWDNKQALLHYERYPFKMAKGKMTMNAPLRKGAAITSMEEDEVRRFVGIYGDAGTGHLLINRPTGRGVDDRSRNLAYKLRHIAISSGITESAIMHRSYKAQSSKAPVVLSFERIFAVTPKCGGWDRDIARDYEKGVMPNFGCAFQHNLAAMAANPRDLLGPRVADRESAGRRGVIMDAYRQGSASGADREGTVGRASDIGN